MQPDNVSRQSITLKARHNDACEISDQFQAVITFHLYCRLTTTEREMKEMCP